MSPEKDTKIDEIVEELSKRIAQGHYVADQRFPSERELAEELNVSRVTIRAALLRLQAENLVDIVPREAPLYVPQAQKLSWLADLN